MILQQFRVGRIKSDVFELVWVLIPNIYEYEYEHFNTKCFSTHRESNKSVTWTTQTNWITKMNQPPKQRIIIPINNIRIIPTKMDIHFCLLKTILNQASCKGFIFCGPIWHSPVLCFLPSIAVYYKPLFPSAPQQIPSSFVYSFENLKQN